MLRFVRPLIFTLFKYFITAGKITITVGTAPAETLSTPYKWIDDAPHPHIWLSNDKSLLGLLLNPQLKFGEYYMSGDVKPLDCTLEDVISFLLSNAFHRDRSVLLRLNFSIMKWMGCLKSFNPIPRSQVNVKHHYDLTDELFDTFLDPRRQYSCAYFHDEHDSLEEAQIAKLARLAAKLALKEGQSVLDIGCGWGGLAMALAKAEPAISVTGITLSQNQHDYAAKQIADNGLSDKVSVSLTDFRELEPDGVAVIHAIGKTGEALSNNPWIEKYIFPGGYIPSLSQMMVAIEKSGLMVADVEIMRLHYAETLKAWRAAFEARKDHVISLYDEPFYRMWQFYLAGSEYSFRSQANMVFQIQLVHKQTAVPLTRRYISENEARYRERLCNKQDFGQKNSSQR
ncbi:MAG: class I SAM-dependent methyltransferase [Alphaproteobacteria bacterium]|nr:class I SAM-dependent methyltransferase [Alphaproteobacteria bacterium]